MTGAPRYALALGDVLTVLKEQPDNAFDALFCDPPYFLEFMGKAWDTAGKLIPAQEQVFRAWLAGLIAGEGYFRIQKTHGGQGYSCNFGIHMRQDEAPLLRGLQQRIGAGEITTGDARSNGLVNSAPDVRWVIQSREDCKKIAALLDGQPLFAKKQREYDVWRRALEEWCTKPRGNRWDGPSDWSTMEALYEEMKTLRPYDAELAESFCNPFGTADYKFHFAWAKEALRVLKPGAPFLAFGGTRTFARMTCAIEDAGFEIRDCLMWLHGKGFPKSSKIGLPDGYGSALKPAWEPVILARKPLEGTMAANVAKWGVGGLAIDACRIGDAGGTTKGNPPKGESNGIYGNGLNGACDIVDLGAGRWPANLILDEVAAEQLDEQTGPRPSTPYRANEVAGSVLPLTKRTAGGYKETGGPSRFFYCSKVSTREREHGCDALPKKTAGECTDREEDSAGLDNPRAGARGQTGGARNHHPTLKPIALTEYMARLIKPPTADAVLLVPFAGAGSEVIGALRAGWPAVLGIEREAEYVAIADARIPANVPGVEKVA